MRSRVVGKLGSGVWGIYVGVGGAGVGVRGMGLGDGVTEGSGKALGEGLGNAVGEAVGMGAAIVHAARPARIHRQESDLRRDIAEFYPRSAKAANILHTTKKRRSADKAKTR